MDTRRVSTLLSIGEFSRLTHLSVKALRHYHDVGLLEPAQIDPATGYRFYATAQVPTALVIRRFRELDMPIDDVRTVLDARDLATRDEATVAHLRRMETQLEQTQSTIASLRGLLDGSESRLPVEYRRAPVTPSLAIAERVDWDDTEGWLAAAFPEL